MLHYALAEEVAQQAFQTQRKFTKVRYIVQQTPALSCDIVLLFLFFADFCIA